MLEEFGDYAPWFDLAHPLNQIVRRKPTIEELEAILSSEEDVALEILPNGEIRAAGKGASEIGGRKPLTMRENLGGEYGQPMRQFNGTPIFARGFGGLEI
jgi:hypothetical protein